VTESASAGAAVERIHVRVRLGDNLLAATDDPFFLGLEGPCGREFRLAFAHGRSLRRGAEDLYVLATPDDDDANVAHPELNDPTQPRIRVDGVRGVYVRKGLDPVPNVRAVGEMDDRVQVLEVEVELHVAGDAPPVRFFREGPAWLGLVCGLRLDLAPGAAGS